MNGALTFRGAAYHFVGQRMSCPSSQNVVRNDNWSITTTCLTLLRDDTNIRPIVLTRIRHAGRTWRTKQNYLELTPAYDDTGKLLLLTCESLGFHVFASTREELLLELAEQVAMLWDEYASEEDENLTETAVQLKRNLLTALEEVKG